MRDTFLGVENEARLNSQPEQNRINLRLVTIQLEDRVRAQSGSGPGQVQYTEPMLR